MIIRPIEVLFEVNLITQDFDLEVPVLEEYELAFEDSDNYDMVLDGAREYDLDIE